MMATVTALATHLLGLLQPTGASGGPLGAKGGKLDLVEPSSAARLAFYHFLKNLCEPGEPLTSATLERFFRRSLTHAHWNENKLALFSEVTACLQHFSNQFNEPLPLAPFESAFSIQTVRAESFKSLERVVEEWVRRTSTPADQNRVLRDREERLIVVRLAQDRKISVYLFDRNLCIRDGVLEPLIDDAVLHYNSDLTLDPLMISQIEVAPHTVARFHSRAADGSTTLQGNIVRGFTFQKVQGLDGVELHKNAQLFYPLKRIEQFFIRRESDPLYIELTGLLEKASDLLSQKHPEALRFAEAALERGKLVFEQVFDEDRMLRLLLENLERAMKLAKLSSLPAATQAPTGSAPHAELANSQRIGSSPGSTVGSKIGLNLSAGHEFVESPLGPTPDRLDEKTIDAIYAGAPWALAEEALGPDLVELQESESCETIKPRNLVPPRSNRPQV